MALALAMSDWAEADLSLGPHAAELTEALFFYSTLHSTSLIILTLLLMLLLCWLWPASSSPLQSLELHWTVEPRESERRKIQRLILPTDAIAFETTASPPEASASIAASPASSVVRRMSASVSAATGHLTGLYVPEQGMGANPYKWRFLPNSAPRGITPLLVFVNRGSGGRQGEALLAHFRRLLSPQQVVDLSAGHAEEVLQSFRTVGQFRVLVCGGDGTVGWVLSLLDGAGLEYTPPVAILPLGTGNDLARALGWGGGARGGNQPMRDMIPLLQEVEKGQVALLDRWQVAIEHGRNPRKTGTRSKAGRTNHSHIMQNYLGIGVDAKVALEWHRRRQSSPQLFSSRWRNKVEYARHGVRHMLRRDSTSELCAQLVIEADGIPIELPPGTQGLIVLNIASYGGGSDLWGADLADPDPPPDRDAFHTHELSELWELSEELDESSQGAHWAWGTEGREADGGQGVSKKAALPGGKAAAPGASPPGPAAAQSARAQHQRSAIAGTASLHRVASHGSRSRSGSDVGYRSAAANSRSQQQPSRSRTRTPPPQYSSPSMDDGLLEVVAVEGVLQLGLAQMSLTNARRVCQCSTLTLSSMRTLQMQVDGEPFEMEPVFAPRRPMTISVSHHNQSVMLSRSSVRADGVALEALDWALQEGVISVEQRNHVMREVARRTGSLQRSASRANLASGSFASLHALDPDLQ